MSTRAVRRAALTIFLGAATCATVSGQSRSTMRFAELDANRDGVITRREWKGNDRSFEVHDWNHDGILSGDEVRPTPTRRPIEGTTGSNDQYTDWTAGGFTALDRNRDNRISREEWRTDVDTFRRIDANRDGILSRAEFLGEDEVVDRDRDVRRDRFAALDTNNDSRVSRTEWTGTQERFALLDVNRDSVLSRDEFEQSPAAPRSQAWTQGHDRGVIDGRQAGKEDRQLRNAWDLEGQRELETADAGYDQRFGDRADYQAGYREGFRRAYAEGFGPRSR